MEEKNVAEFVHGFPLKRDVTFFNARTQLSSVLTRFYQVGLQLYGVHLNPENLTVTPDANVNAFATGSHVFINAGLMQYFLRPTDYVAEIVKNQNGQITSEQYATIQASFPWENDWDSIYFVLAHEASHN